MSAEADEYLERLDPEVTAVRVLQDLRDRLTAERQKLWQMSRNDDGEAVCLLDQASGVGRAIELVDEAIRTVGVIEPFDNPLPPGGTT